MDTIYTFADYGQDSRPRLQFPKRTGRRTSYREWLAYQYALHHDDALPAIGFDAPPAPAFVNHGRWLWQCPACMTAVQVCDDNTVDGADLICCPACFSQGFVQPEFPAARAEIEAELLRQPGYRHNAPFRNWEPGWGLDYLRDRTAAAQAKLDAGETFVRAASIGTPRTWAVGEVLTASNMNTFVREIQKDLSGANGPVELLHGMRPGSFTTAELAALSGVPEGTMFYDATLDDIRYKAMSGIVPAGLGREISPLFELQGVTEITHSLGRSPLLFQFYIERVRDTNWRGWTLGDKYYVDGPADSIPLGFYDVSATSYKVFTNSIQVRIKNVTQGASETASDGANIDNDPQSGMSSGGWGARIIAFA